MNPTPSAAARASMNDVAALAGVSAQTVSRVANDHPRVLPDTRERVLAAMRELGYRPNRAARSLKAGRFRSIGVVVFNISTLGNARTLGVIAESAAAAGYTTTLIAIADPTQLEVTGAFGRLEEQAVDGIILIMSADVGSPDELALTAGLPLVIVDSDAHVPHTIVDTDQEQGSRAAMRHLLDLGHRRIAHIAGPARSFSARRRAAAYRAVVGEEGLGDAIVEQGNWTAVSGRDAARRLLDREPHPTAVFAANDQMALGVLHAAHERGLRVPEDVSVVGFDDAEDAATYWPALTTVHQNFEEVGQRATRALIALIDETPAPDNPLVPTTLIVRDSTGPVPG